LKREKGRGNLHLVLVHKLNGWLKSPVLYRGMVEEDEKSAGTGPKKVVVVPVEVDVDVDKGI
jgi:hypothetical protein